MNPERSGGGGAPVVSRRGLALLAALALAALLAAGAQAAEPDAPRHLSAEPGPSGGEISLAWDAPTDDGGPDVEEYRVYRADSSDGPYQHVGAAGGGMAAGTVTVESTAQINFPAPMNGTPLVFAQPMMTDGTAEDPAWVTTVEGVDQTGFTVRYCEQNGQDDCYGSPPAAEVAWWALDPTVADKSESLDWGTVQTGANTWEPVAFDQAFDTAPVVIATVQTHNGTQKALYAEARNVDAASAEVRFCESDGDDDCDSHRTETVAWLAVEPGQLAPKGAPLGEAGRVSGLDDDNRKTVDFAGDFLERPLVFATTQTVNGGQDPSNPVVKDVSSGGFQTWHCEYEYSSWWSDYCDDHASETNGWIAIDPARIPRPTWTDAGLEANQTYHYNVTAVNSDGEGPPSGIVDEVPFPPGPDNPTAAPGPGVGEITLDWEAPSGEVTGYRLYHNPNGPVRGDAELLADIETTAYTHGGLGDGTTHHYWIAPYNQGGENDDHVEGQAPDRPEAPTGLTAEGGVGNVSLDWEPPEDDGGLDVTTYRIYRADGSSSESLVAEVDGTTYTDDGLADDTTYAYRVSAVNDVGEGNKTQQTEATTAGPPAAPEGLDATSGPDAGETTITWSAPSDDGGANVTAYRIYRQNATASESLVAEVTSLSYVDSGLADNTTYAYRVSAVNEVGEGPTTSWIDVRTPSRPDPPEGLEATTGPGEGEISLVWEEPSEDGGLNVTAYRIYRENATASPSLVAEVTSRSYVDSGLADNTTYAYRVSAVNDVGEGDQSQQAEARTPARPQAPGNVTATPGPGEDEITLTWEDLTGEGPPRIVGYEVLRASTSNGTYETVATPGVGMAAGTVTADPTAEVSFPTPMNGTPLVFVEPLLDPSQPGEPSWTTRLESVNETGFTLEFCEQESTDGCDDDHPSHEVAWWALDPAVADKGGSVDWGTVTVDSGWYSTSWTSVTFDPDFDEIPVVLATVQTYNGRQQGVYPEVRGVDTDGATVGFCESEADNECDSHTDETVAWLAVEPGSVTIDDLTIGTAGRMTGLGGNTSKSVDLGGNFSQSPYVFATTQTANGWQNPSHGLVQDVNENGFETFHCEYDGPDTCDGHNEETNGWIAVDPVKASGGAPEWTDAGLEPDTTYHYKVRAITPYLEGPTSEEVNGTTPTLPRNVTATPGPATDEITLDWDQPDADVEGYRVYHNPDGPDRSQASLLVETNQTEYVHGNLAEGSLHHYWVAVVLPDQENEVAIQEQAPHSPEPPTGLATETGVGEISLAWDPSPDDGGFNVTTYRLYRENATTNESLLAEVDSRNYTDTGLADDATFTYRVSAVNDVGEGNKSAWVEETTASLPSAPDGLAASTGPGAGDISLAWAPPTDSGGIELDAYRVYRTNDSTSEVLVAEVGPSTTELVDEGLPDNETFSYRVSAVNGVGEGNRTSWAEASTPALPASPQPSDAFRGPDGDELTVTWDPPLDDGGTPVTAYRLYRSNETQDSFHLITEISTTSHVDQDLEPGTTYTYRIAAVNDVGEGPLSSAVDATTYKAPHPVENLAVSRGPGAGEIKVTWEKPSQEVELPVTGYKVYRANTSGGPYEHLASREIHDVEAGGFETGITRMNSVAQISFAEPMSSKPLVFVQPMLTDRTAEDPAWVTTVEDVDESGFTIRFCEQNSDDGCYSDPPAPEVAWWAVDPTVADEAETMDWGRIQTEDASFAEISFQEYFASPPVVLANLQTHNGGERALYAEARNVDTLGAEVRFCESDGDDGCDRHTQETVAWLAVEPGQLSVLGNPLGEAGRATGLVDDTAKTVEFGETFGDRPAVFATTQTQSGEEDPSSAVVTDVSRQAFGTWHCQYDQYGWSADECDTHPKETNGWIAVDRAQTVNLSREWTDSDLAANETYHYRVVAVNDAGESANATTVQTWAPDRPGPPRNLEAEPGPRDRTVRLDWDPPRFMGGVDLVYRVYQVDQETGEANVLADYGNVTSFVAGQDPDGSLYPDDATRSFRVAALNPVGEGAHSTNATGRTPSAPGVPQNLTAREGSRLGQVVVSWEPPADDGGLEIDQYWVYRTGPGGATTSIRKTGDQTSHRDQFGPRNQKEYTYRVAAEQDVAEGSKSEENSTQAFPWGSANESMGPPQVTGPSIEDLDPYERCPECDKRFR